MNIDKSEILRYLGYGGQALDSRTIKLIDSCVKKIESVIKPRYVYVIFKISEMENGIKLIGTNLILEGKNIKNHLRGCGYCAVLAATLGIDADNLIRVTQKISMSEAVVLDACAVEFIEKVCGGACADIENKLKEEDSEFKITSRFSPGYGDLTIDIQPEILRITDAERKIGLTVTETNIMIPRKSVTAMIGIYKGERKSEPPKSCGSCAMKNTCVYSLTAEPRCGTLAEAL